MRGTLGHPSLERVLFGFWLAVPIYISMQGLRVPLPFTATGCAIVALFGPGLLERCAQ